MYHFHDESSSSTLTLNDLQIIQDFTLTLTDLGTNHADICVLHPCPPENIYQS